jgi:hypothetical protein
VRDSRSSSGELTYVAGPDRLQLVKDLPVTNVATDQVLALSAAGPLYSSWWQNPGAPLPSLLAVSSSNPLKMLVSGFCRGQLAASR